MNEQEYQQRIDAGDVLDGTTLNITIKELTFRKEHDLARELQRILDENGITKPAQGSGSLSKTYYVIDLTDAEIERIIDLFMELEAEHVNEEGKATPTAAFYASLVDKWDLLA